jgi:hypothetical protein
MEFKEVPNRAVFRILKENGHAKPRDGVFVKVGNSHSRAYSASKEIILGLSDVVRVIHFPKSSGK